MSGGHLKGKVGVSNPGTTEALQQRIGEELFGPPGDDDALAVDQSSGKSGTVCETVGDI